jgi:16S rRNA U1498 N3-methylase RsmE
LSTLCVTAAVPRAAIQVRASKQLARVVVPGQPLKDQGAYTLNAEDTKHVTKVLRCSTGDYLELVNGEGKLQQVSIAAVQSNGRRPASASVRPDQGF